MISRWLHRLRDWLAPGDDAIGKLIRPPSYRFTGHDEAQGVLGATKTKERDLVRRKVAAEASRPARAPADNVRPFEQRGAKR